MSTLRSSDFNRQITLVRKHLRQCAQATTWADAYAEAEQAQHEAFELKNMIAVASSIPK